MTEENKIQTLPLHKIIICEGKNDKIILNAYINHLFGEKNKQTDNSHFYILPKVGGKSKIEAALKTLPNYHNFKKVKVIIIVRDKDENNAEKSVQNIFERNGYAVPNKQCTLTEKGSEKYPDIRTGYAIFPFFDETNGAIESFLLNTIKDKGNVYNISENAVKEVKEKCGEFKNSNLENKIRLHTYLSLNEKYVESNIGVAANKGAFDFDSPLLAPLKELFTAAENICSA
jgi:hypothetical protein